MFEIGLAVVAAVLAGDTRADPATARLDDGVIRGVVT